jgi:hypothetical protein
LLRNPAFHTSDPQARRDMGVDFRDGSLALHYAPGVPATFTVLILLRSGAGRSTFSALWRPIAGSLRLCRGDHEIKPGQGCHLAPGSKRGGRTLGRHRLFKRP